MILWENYMKTLQGPEFDNLKLLLNYRICLYLFNIGIGIKTLYSKIKFNISIENIKNIVDLQRKHHTIHKRNKCSQTK